MARADAESMSHRQRWLVFSLTNRLISSKLATALEQAANLSPLEFTLLETLDSQRGVGSSMQDIADAMMLSQSATSRLVSRLEERGAVRRSWSEHDRRSISTTLTDDGRDLLSRARPIHDAALEEAISEASDRPGLGPIVEMLRSSTP